MNAVSRLGNIFEDLAIKAAARLATTGASIVLSGLQAIDGVQSADGDRVLVKDQTDARQNGIWQVTTGPWIRTRDASGNTDFIDGSLVLVSHGVDNAGELFVASCSDSPVVIGTSLLHFTSQTDVLAQRQTATSGTGNTVGIGGKTFGIVDGKDINAGQYVLIYQTSSPANAMLALVDVNDSGTLGLTSIAASGSGTHSDWTIVLAYSPASAGRVPPIGTGNVTGPGSAVAGRFAVFSDTTGKVVEDSGITPGTLAGRSALAYGDAGSASIQAAALVPGSTPLPYVGTQPNDNLRLVNDAVNPTRDINVLRGRCRDDVDVSNLHLASAMVKRLDQAWAAGGNSGAPAGACDTGTKGANQTWHVFLIAKLSVGISSVSRTSNVATIVSAGHGGGLGGTVSVFGMGGGLDVLTTITAVTTNSISYANAGPDIGAGVLGGAFDVHDVLASQSYTAPSLPAGWTVKQCLGSFMTDGSGNIRQHLQIGDRFHWVSPPVDVNATTSTSARVATTLTVPNGVAVTAQFRAGINVGAGSPGAIIFTSLQEADQAAVNGSTADLANVTNAYANGSFERLTSTSAQIGVRSLNNNTAQTIVTLGYRDPRRRLF